ncbi:uncharacterized protein MELLADRAFT_105139 [Melampsora larici-populina 98AG31]|uniref:Uncharacterized protein n=1 Tax=Melampsora larici-populina (strain 98AG31 / pathotype 3-4-7) TaxID=747676 RepID=F4RGR7_MELLP|nr:uncharacterized protein MELLADRAFT_105139 [Melampsora larici-populina 98AG31]EGG08345.1 hypothetical protein MELLADRAFT_105139 [Melampsora larici-populina 98AG31]
MASLPISASSPEAPWSQSVAGLSGPIARISTMLPHPKGITARHPRRKILRMIINSRTSFYVDQSPRVALRLRRLRLTDEDGLQRANQETIDYRAQSSDDGIASYTSSQIRKLKPEFDEMSGVPDRHEMIFKVPKYQDKLSRKLLMHLMTSPKFDQLHFAQNHQLVHRLQSANNLAFAEKIITDALKKCGLEDLEHTVKLQVWGQFANVCWKNLSDAEVTHQVEIVISKLNADTKAAKAASMNYAQAVSKGNYGVILDDEADDLLFLLLQLEDGIIPKFLIPYGGFTELRYQSVVQFVDAACKHYKIPPEKVPKVYRGFPHIYIEDEARHPYDYEEGFGYLMEEERVRYIEQSQALEKSLKDDAGKTFREDAWDHPIFKAGLDALRDMIDKADYTAIAVLTSPAPLTHLLEENPERAKKVGVTMASPWSYALNEDGVLYSHTYNSGINLKAMNGLLKSGVEFIGVGGGTAKTKGMRTIHDYGHGSQQAGLYPDMGLKNLEKVVSTKSPLRIFKITAYAGANMTTGIWRVWDRNFSELWEFLGIKETERSGLEQLRQRPKNILPLIEKEEGMRRAGKGLQSERKERFPEAACWGLDKVVTLWKIWYLWGDTVKWQSASADLHAIITGKPTYVEDILGAVRYQSKAWNDESEHKGQPSSSQARLDKLVNCDRSNTYSLSDLRYEFIINKLQTFIDKYSGKQAHKSNL